MSKVISLIDREILKKIPKEHQDRFKKFIADIRRIEIVKERAQKAENLDDKVFWYEYALEKVEALFMDYTAFLMDLYSNAINDHKETISLLEETANLNEELVRQIVEGDISIMELIELAETEPLICLRILKDLGKEMRQWLN